MDLKEIIRNFIEQPYPIWECELTEKLVKNKLDKLKTYGISNLNEYSTVRFLNGYDSLIEKRFSISNNSENDTIYLEAPSFDKLQTFYDKHGLNPCSEQELESNDVIVKLKDAISIYELVKQGYSFITSLVRSIQALKQEDPEIDSSYSHPRVPFSIFVSVCEDNSMISRLRVAESILHEAMHLKLTLIEEILPLVKHNSGNLYFSPWRDKKRHARGVLHGLFVFKTIFKFYSELESTFDSNITSKYLMNRKAQITKELEELKDFSSCPDLTLDGAILSKNLLPLN